MMVELAAWLVTLAIHSSVLLVAVWAISAAVSLPERVREVLWKAAAFGALPTSLLQHWRGAEPVAGYVAVLGPSADTAPLPSASDFGAAAEVGAAVSAPVCLAMLAIAAAAWAMLHLLAQCWRARRLLRDRQPAPAPLLAELAAVRDDCGRHRRVRLTVSRALRVPIATGVLRPEICLPAAIAALDSSERRAVLAHEFGHLLRHDPLWLRAFLVVQCLFPWQPLLRLARRRVDELSEYACDALAAELAGANGTARCLVTVADWLRATPAPRFVTVASMATRGSLLARRVDRLLSGRGVTRLGRHRWWLVPGVGLLLGTSALALPAAAFAVPLPLAVPASLPADAGPLARAAALLDAECASLTAEFARLQRELPVDALDAADRALLNRLGARVAALDTYRSKISQAVRTLDVAAGTAPNDTPR